MVALQDRATARWVIAIVAQELEITFEWITAAQCCKRRRVVIGHRMVHAAHDRQTIHHTRYLGQVLADPNPWHRGGNRAELTADLCRGTRLHVISVNMARPAIMKDQDAGADRPHRPRGGLHLVCRRTESLGAAEQEESTQVNLTHRPEATGDDSRSDARVVRFLVPPRIAYATPSPSSNSQHCIAGKLFNFHWRIEACTGIIKTRSARCTFGKRFAETK